MFSARRWSKRAAVAILLALACLGVAEARQETVEAERGAVLPTRFCRGYFLADVHLNGRGPFPMVVDTGASVTVISPRAHRMAGIRGRIDEMVIGPLTARRVRNVERELEHLGFALGTEIAGIVGHPVFRGVLVTYDYPNRQLRVRQGSLPRSGEGIVPTSDGDRPFVGARIGAHELTILVDTGSSGGLTLTDLEDRGLVAPPVPVGARGRLDGFYLKTVARLAEPMTIGPITLPQPVASNSVSVNLLGQQILEHFAVTFDARNGRMLLERDGAPLDEPIVLPVEHSLGAAFVPFDGYHEVRRIFDGSEADDRGLREGDRVVAIDGRRIADLQCESALDGLQEGELVALSVERDGVAIDLELPVTAWPR